MLTSEEEEISIPAEPVVLYSGIVTGFAGSDFMNFISKMKLKKLKKAVKCKLPLREVEFT